MRVVFGYVLFKTRQVTIGIYQMYEKGKQNLNPF